MRWRGLTQCVWGHEIQVDPKKKLVCHTKKLRTSNRMRNMSLVEAIVKGPGLVKEALRLILFKMNQFGFKKSEMKVSTFGISEI